MKKILVAIDFSPAASNAYEYAVWLSLALEAELHLIYVNPAVQASPTLPQKALRELVARDNLEYEQRLRRLATAYPDRVPEQWSELRLKSLRVRNGRAVPALVKEARELSADLLVVGVRSKHYLQDYLFGSVSTKLIEQTPCPLLMIPEGYAFRPVRNIAFAVDITAEAQPMKLILEDFADSLGAEIRPFFVNMLPEEQDKLKVERIKARHMDLDMVRDFSVSRGIDYYLESASAQMLAMYLPERAFPEKLLHGKLAKREAWKSPLPFMVFGER